ncbi:MAG: HPP family protein [Moraxellaceae bacterium]|nr:HPP family protein [Moraxellaceae bacterium]
MSAFIRTIRKLRGEAAALPPAHPASSIALAWLGGALAIAATAGLSEGAGAMLILGSFGASAVLIFGFPDVPFSQPRNIVAGHVLSTLIGLIFLHAFGATWWSVALAAGTAIAVMMATRTVHPPAGSNPVIVYLAQPDWSFLLAPTLLGSLVLVAVATLYLNLSREARYPKYWW